MPGPSRAIRQKRKHKSKRQVRYLLSKGSPLSGSQKSKLKHELHDRRVVVD